MTTPPPDDASEDLQRRFTSWPTVLLMALSMLGSSFATYLSVQATEGQAIAILTQRFGDMQAQLATIETQTVNMPVSHEQIVQIKDHLHTVDGRLDTDDTSISGILQRQSAIDAEVQGIIRASGLQQK